MKKILLVGTLIGLTAFFIVHNITKTPTTITFESPIYNISVFEDALNQEVVPEKDYSANFEKLVDLIKSKKGQYSVYIKDLSTQKTYTYNSEQEYYAASLYKMPIAFAALKQIENKQLTWETQVGSYTIDQLFTLMLKNSDNNAQAILHSTLPESIVKSSFTVYDTKPYSRFYDYNEASASQIGTLLENFTYDDYYLTQDSKNKFVETVSKTAFDDRIAKTLRPGLFFGHKIGNWPEKNNWHDCGIVYGDASLIVCIMTQDVSFDNFIEVSNYLGSIL